MVFLGENVRLEILENNEGLIVTDMDNTPSGIDLVVLDIWFFCLNLALPACWSIHILHLETEILLWQILDKFKFWNGLGFIYRQHTGDTFTDSWRSCNSNINDRQDTLEYLYQNHLYDCLNMIFKTAFGWSQRWLL